MFWGLVVQPNKKYSKTVSTPFHVSQAVLDVTNVSNDAEVQLILKSDKVDYILCILKKSGIVQVPLDLIFSEGDDISFRSVGGTVHLTGYLVDDQNLDVLEDGESSDAEEDVPQLVDASRSNKKKQKQQSVQAEQESSSENENSAESQGEEEASDEDDEDEGDDDDDDEDEDVNESDEESAEPPPAKIQKTNGMANGVQKKASAVDGKSKKQQPQPQQQNTEKTTKQLQGGVKVDDLRVGQGSVAKAGKKVQVYYEGRFKKNNKVFDKANTGKGFEFILGKGEVIKGWDVGIQGMKIGGKRRILCPPQMAYGSKGAPPAVPPNSTLVFEVELRNVN